MPSVYHAIIALSGVFLLGGCAHSQPVTEKPAWLLRPPSQVFGKACALGRSGATLYAEDARVHAAESARVALAEAEQVSVRSKMIDVQTNSTSQGYGSQVAQVSEITREGILRNSEVIEYFYDSDGFFTGGEKNVTFAVVCLR